MALQPKHRCNLPHRPLDLGVRVEKKKTNKPTNQQQGYDNPLVAYSCGTMLRDALRNEKVRELWATFKE